MTAMMKEPYLRSTPAMLTTRSLKLTRTRSPIIGDKMCIRDRDIDKDQMDDIYDSLMNKGIEVSMESEPDDIELMEMDDEGKDSRSA